MWPRMVHHGCFFKVAFQCLDASVVLLRRLNMKANNALNVTVEKKDSEDFSRAFNGPPLYCSSYDACGINRPF